MKLYYTRGACSLAVRIVINEIGADCDFVSVDLNTKKTEHGLDYLTISAKGAVPALSLDNGELLTENAVIQQYLADAFSATRLLPPLGDFNRYRVLEWLNFVSSDVHKSFSPFFNPNMPKEVLENVCKPLLVKKLDHADQRLVTHKFLTGEHFTLADCYLFVALTWLGATGLSLSQWPNLARFFNDAKARPSVQKALADESLTA